jgi:hypothetical protein
MLFFRIAAILVCVGGAIIGAKQIGTASQPSPTYRLVVEGQAPVRAPTGPGVHVVPLQPVARDFKVEEAAVEIAPAQMAYLALAHIIPCVLWLIPAAMPSEFFVRSYLFALLSMPMGILLFRFLSATWIYVLTLAMAATLVAGGAVFVRYLALKLFPPGPARHR